MLAYHWRLYRWLLLLVVVVLAASIWVTIAWWQGIADHLAALQKERLMGSELAPARVVNIYNEQLPSPYTLIESMRGDIAPSSGLEVLAIGQDQNDHHFAAFVLDAAHTVQFTSPLPAQPVALEAHARTTTSIVFRLVFPAAEGAEQEYASRSLDIRWDGTRYVIET